MIQGFTRQHGTSGKSPVILPAPALAPTSVFRPGLFGLRGEDSSHFPLAQFPEGNALGGQR